MLPADFDKMLEERIEIAGSVRRRTPAVGDIEIICIPKYEEDLLGDPTVSLIDPIVAGMQKLKDGPRYKQLLLEDDVHLDLWITTPIKWGMAFTVRTGPARFSKALVTPRHHGGLLPSHLLVRDSQLWRWGDGIAESTPEERDVLEKICGGWIDPDRRADWLQALGLRRSREKAKRHGSCSRRRVSG